MSLRPLNRQRSTLNAATRAVLTSATWTAVDINCCYTGRPDVRYIGRGRHQLLQHAMPWRPLHGKRSTSTTATNDVLTFATWTEVDINCCNMRCRDLRYMDRCRYQLLQHATCSQLLRSPSLLLRLTSCWSLYEPVSVWTLFLRSASNEAECTH